MIFAPLQALSGYFQDDWWRQASAIISTLGPDAPDGEISVGGRDVFIRILTYNTVAEDRAVLETHRSYVDVQLALKGEERIAVWPAATLRVREVYDPVKDVIYYQPSGTPMVQMRLRPGYAAVFLPADAHMPGLIEGEPTLVKKVVVKVAVARCGLLRYIQQMQAGR